MVWIVITGGGLTERVDADGWQVGPNGDLVFFNGGGSHQILTRAYAAGRWQTVTLYA